MPIETITPADKKAWLALRTLDVTSTEVSALFGLSPYLSAYQLWRNKKNGTVNEIEENDRMKWGTRLQDSIAAGIAQDNRWIIQRMDAYVRDPEKRIGSSFDFAIKADEINAAPQALLEIKNVGLDSFSKGWLVDGSHIEAPLHIELQVQHQMLVSGIPVCYIGALIGGNDVRLLKREADLEIHANILQAVALFWDSIKNDTPPEPNWERDAKFVQSMHQKAGGPAFDASESETIQGLAMAYKEYCVAETKAKEGKDIVKAQILSLIGQADKVMGNGFTISCGETVSTFVEAYERSAYRNFRITWKGQKNGKG